MTIYIRFEQNKQVETTTLENKPEEGNWYEAPENFDWQKNYCLTDGGEIAERSKKDIQDELLQNAKSSILSDLDIYFNNYTNRYAGNSHQKARSYEIQAKVAENILASNVPFAEKDTQIIEPLAKIRGISVVQMAELIQEKAKKAVKAIAKCEEMEDLAKKRIKEAKTQEELQSFLSNFEHEIKNSLASLEE